MTRHVHIHLHRARAGDAEEKGKWVTINGAHVFVGEGGKITKGPKAMVGKSEGEAAGHKHGAEGTRENRYRELAAKARKDGNALEEARWLKAAEKEGTREGGKGDLVESEKQKAKNEYADKNKRPAPTEAPAAERNADREQQTKAPVAPEKKMSKADAFKAGKLEHDRASKGQGSYEKAAEHFEQAGEKGRAEQSRALSKQHGHDKGNAPGQTQVSESRHAEKGGAPEGAAREGGPLKQGEKGVRLHKDFAEGDAQEYEVVSAEEKGRVGISPVRYAGAIRPNETVEGYMVHRGTKQE